MEKELKNILIYKNEKINNTKEKKHDIIICRTVKFRKGNNKSTKLTQIKFYGHFRLKKGSKIK